MKKLILCILLSAGVHTIASDYVIPIVNSDSSHYLVGDDIKPIIPEPELDVQFKDVVTGYRFSYALDTDGVIWSTGRNHKGQLGLADKDPRNSWTKTTMSGVTKVVAGWYFAYALDSEGNVWSVGDNSSGQLGLGDIISRDTWTKTNLSSVNDITAGSSHGLALKGGELYVVGDNGHGQLGLGNDERKTSWLNTKKTGVLGVSAGAGSSYLLMSNGRVESAGFNSSGQLGIGTFSDSYNWTDTKLTGVSKIYGAKFNLYVVKGIDLFAVGSNLYQQLGIGAAPNQSNFVDTTMDNINQLYTDRGHHFVYAKKGSEIWQIGLNNGQLGTGDKINAPYWTKTNLVGVDKVALGDQFAIYLKDGDVSGTGSNSYGELATGNTTSKTNWTESLEVFDEKEE